MTSLLQPLSGGYSGAELYRIVLPDHARVAAVQFPYLDLSRLAAGNYCLKIRHLHTHDESPRRIPAICAVYESLGIPSLHLFQAGPTPDGRYYSLYQYIDGENFELAGEKLPAAENYRVGVQVGTWLRQLKDAPIPAILADASPDFDQLTAEARERYSLLRSNATAEQLLLEFFAPDLLDSIPARLDQTRTAFYGLEPRLIHGDIKRSNLIYDPSGRVWLIDIEAMRPSYDFYNFRYQMTWMLSDASATKPEFNRGLFDGLYHNSRPARFQDQLVYTLLFNFLEFSTKHLADLDELQAFFRRLQPVLPLALSSVEPIV